IDEVRVGALGFRLRSRPAASKLGWEDHFSAASAADVLPAVRRSDRRRQARARWVLGAGAYGARLDALGPLVAVAGAAISISATQVAGTVLGRQRRRAAGADGVGHDRGQRGNAPYERSARRPAAHLWLEPRARVELGLCIRG